MQCTGLNQPIPQRVKMTDKMPDEIRVFRVSTKDGGYKLCVHASGYEASDDVFYTRADNNALTKAVEALTEIKRLGQHYVMKPLPGEEILNAEQVRETGCNYHVYTTAGEIARNVLKEIEASR